MKAPVDEERAASPLPEDEEDMEEIKSCFSLFDKRGDMKVEHDRVIDVLRSLGLNPLTEDMNR